METIYFIKPEIRFPLSAVDLHFTYILALLMSNVIDLFIFVEYFTGKFCKTQLRQRVHPSPLFPIH